MNWSLISNWQKGVVEDYITLLCSFDGIMKYSNIFLSPLTFRSIRGKDSFCVNHLSGRFWEKQRLYAAFMAVCVHMTAYGHYRS